MHAGFSRSPAVELSDRPEETRDCADRAEVSEEPPALKKRKSGVLTKPNDSAAKGAIHPSLVLRPTSQLRMDYITATRVVGLVSSCTNFCPVAPECWSDQSDLRYALIAYSSYQSKLSDMTVRLEMDDVQVKRAIQSAGERMGHAKVKDEQFRVIEDVVRVRDTFVSLPTGYGKSLCYGVLPWVFDELSRNSTKRSIVKTL